MVRINTNLDQVVAVTAGVIAGLVRTADRAQHHVTLTGSLRAWKRPTNLKLRRGKRYERLSVGSARCSVIEQRAPYAMSDRCPACMRQPAGDSPATGWAMLVINHAMSS